MKLFMVAVFTCFIASAICESDESDESGEGSAEFKVVTDACAKEVGIAADAWEKLEDDKFDDPKLPDFVFCIYKKINFLNDKGEYQLDTIKAVFTETYSEEVATKFIKTCTKETYATGPETALHLAQCAQEVVPDRK